MTSTIIQELCRRFPLSKELSLGEDNNDFTLATSDGYPFQNNIILRDIFEENLAMLLNFPFGFEKADKLNPRSIINQNLSYLRVCIIVHFLFQ